MGVITEGLPALSVAAISFFVIGILIAADMNLSHKSFAIVVVGVGMLIFGWMMRGQG